YSYVNNNPLRYTDPSGHCPVCAVLATNPVGLLILGAAAIGTYAFVPQVRTAVNHGVAAILSAGVHGAVNTYNAAKTLLAGSSSISTSQKNTSGSSGNGNPSPQSPKINPFQKIIPLIPLAGNVNSPTGKATVSEGLTAGEEWLGAGYREIASGVFRSADNLRQFRMTDSDILAKMPHFNFETVAEDGKTLLQNAHIYLLDVNSLNK